MQVFQCDFFSGSVRTIIVLATNHYSNSPSVAIMVRLYRSCRLARHGLIQCRSLQGLWCSRLGLSMDRTRVHHRRVMEPSGYRRSAAYQNRRSWNLQVTVQVPNVDTRFAFRRFHEVPAVRYVPGRVKHFFLVDCTLPVVLRGMCSFGMVPRCGCHRRPQRMAPAPWPASLREIPVGGRSCKCTLNR